MAVTTENESTTFEVSGIERVAESNRQHTQLWDTMWLWWSANAVVATVALGAINIFFGLGFWGSVIVILIFNVLGVLPVAFLSTLGPKTGLAQMPLSRFSFGFQGARLPALFNMAACVGWSAFNSIIGASLITAWSKKVWGGDGIPLWVGLVFLMLITTAVSVFGYFIVHRYERYAWIAMLILFGYVFFASSSHFNLNASPAFALAGGLGLFAGIATFGGAVFGYAVGWSSYAADYTRRQPSSTAPGRVFLYAFLGVTIPCILLEILGVLLTTTGANSDTPGDLISGSIGTSTISLAVLVLLAFSTIANNVPNDYSFALSSQVVGVKNIKRWILTLVGAVLYLILALVLSNKFSQNLQNFLLLIAYWLGAWNAIVLLEHFAFRKGKYPVEDYETPSKLPVGIAAVVAMVVGLGIAALGVGQSLFIGPLAAALSVCKTTCGANPTSDQITDIGFPLAIVAAGILYYVLRRWELSRYKR